MASSAAPHFPKTALAAFPPSYRAVAEQAARSLMPIVDGSYRKSSVQAVVLGKTIQIPRRIHFLRFETDDPKAHDESWVAIQCLYTRSTDGYVRQSSLRRILGSDEAWVIPFVVLLSGEYVVEIIEDIVAALSMLNRDAYVNFVCENRALMRVLKAKATSYWDCYYRQAFPDRRCYPGLAFLHQLELWVT